MSPVVSYVVSCISDKYRCGSLCPLLCPILCPVSQINIVAAHCVLCWELLASGRVKFFDDLVRTKEEYLLYHKDERGRVVKERDHIMDCFRYAMMTGRDLAMNKFDAMPRQNAQYTVSPQYRPSLPMRRN